ADDRLGVLEAIAVHAEHAVVGGDVHAVLGVGEAAHALPGPEPEPLELAVAPAPDAAVARAEPLVAVRVLEVAVHRAVAVGDLGRGGLARRQAVHAFVRADPHRPGGILAHGEHHAVGGALRRAERHDVAVAQAVEAALGADPHVALGVLEQLEHHRDRPRQAVHAPVGGHPHDALAGADPQVAVAIEQDLADARGRQAILADPLDAIVADVGEAVGGRAPQVAAAIHRDLVDRDAVEAGRAALDPAVLQAREPAERAEPHRAVARRQDRTDLVGWQPVARPQRRDEHTAAQPQQAAIAQADP